jgi:pimeloyl-ACP methyl ester carboxylesterase
MTLTEQHPESINNLIVVDIAPKAYPDRHRDIFEALLAIDLKRLTKRSDADSQLAIKIKNKAIRQFLLMNLMKEGDGFKWRPNLSVLSDLYSKLIEPVCQNKTINHRGLFIRGGLSDYIEDKDIEMIKQQFPNARVATIDQAGHWVHAELPSQFLTLIRQFLSYD